MIALLPVATNSIQIPSLQGLLALPTSQVDAMKLSLWTSVLSELPTCSPKGPWIAGGAVRRFLLNQYPFTKDIDYFCTDQEQYHSLCSRLETRDARLILETKDHRTYIHTVANTLEEDDDRHYTIQVIKTRFRPTLEAHLNAFDFTICQMGWDGTSFFMTAQGALDLSEKRLIPIPPLHNATGSWMRIVKYARQGFTAPAWVYETVLQEARQQEGLEKEAY